MHTLTHSAKTSIKFTNRAKTVANHIFNYVVNNIFTFEMMFERSFIRSLASLFDWFVFAANAFFAFRGTAQTKLGVRNVSGRKHLNNVKRLVYNINTKIIAMMITILFCIHVRFNSPSLQALCVRAFPSTKSMQFIFTIINPVCVLRTNRLL